MLDHAQVIGPIKAATGYVVQVELTRLPTTAGEGGSLTGGALLWDV